MYFCAKAFFMLLNYFLDSTGVSTDSRTVKEGNIFFALRGENFNGNEYIDSAIDKGALVCVSDDTSLITNQKPKVVYVNDVLVALQNLATEYRRFIGKPVIALTGSNGKTTTKELINVVLKKKFKVHCTKGNYNNHIGVPLTILSSPRDIDLLLIEMGANHQGEIHSLCTIAEPDYGLITNVGKAHLEGFGGVEGVKKGKSEIYRFIASKGGVIFCNENDKDLVALLPENARTVFYKVSYEQIKEGEVLSFTWNGLNVETNLFGSHNLPNAVVALEIGQFFGVPQDLSIEAILNYKPENNRSQIARLDGKIIIKDAYNSNPTSLSASLLSLTKSYDTSKVVIIIGDMLELGDYSMEEHSKIVELIKSCNFKEVWLIGMEFYKLKDTSGIRYYMSTEDARQYFDITNQPEGTIIFLKGSRGIAVEKLFE